MTGMERLLSGYRITGADIKNIRMVSGFLEERKEKIADYHYSKPPAGDEAAGFFKNEAVLERARRAFIGLFEDLISDECTEACYIKVSRAGGYPRAHRPARPPRQHRDGQSPGNAGGHDPLALRRQPGDRLDGPQGKGRDFFGMLDGIAFYITMSAGEGSHAGLKNEILRLRSGGGSERRLEPTDLHPRACGMLA